jgi:hypothetical protein
MTNKRLASKLAKALQLRCELLPCSAKAMKCSKCQATTVMETLLKLGVIEDGE